MGSSSSEALNLFDGKDCALAPDGVILRFPLVLFTGESMSFLATLRRKTRFAFFFFFCFWQSTMWWPHQTRVAVLHRIASCFSPQDVTPPPPSRCRCTAAAKYLVTSSKLLNLQLNLFARTVKLCDNLLSFPENIYLALFSGRFICKEHKIKYFSMHHATGDAGQHATDADWSVKSFKHEQSCANPMSTSPGSAEQQAAKYLVLVYLRKTL